MAGRNMRAAVDRDVTDGTSASKAEASSVDGLLSLTDDELSALVPAAVGSKTPMPPARAAATPATVRRSPKASGKFVTDGGRLAAPKIVKRVTKRDPAGPNKASGAYAKAVAPPRTDGDAANTATALPTRAPSPKLEDFSDLVKELESLVDVPLQEQTVMIPHDQLVGRPAEAPSVFASDVSVEQSIAEAVQAALPQMSTVPLSLATIAASVPTSVPSVSEVHLTGASHAATSVARARAHELLAHEPPLAASTASDAVRASPVPAPPASPKRARSVVRTMFVTALLGMVAAGAWIAGGAWTARRQALSSQPNVSVAVPLPSAPESNVVGTATPPAPAPESAVAAAAPTAVSADPQAAPAATAHQPSTARAASPPVAAAAKPMAAAQQTAAPTTESTAAVAAAEPAKDPPPASKPTRRSRSSKTNDEARANSEAKDEVDEETKKALEALQKSQLESSF